MRIGILLAVGVQALLLSSSSASAEVALTIQEGRVTLVAKDATLRQILAEWARIGQTKIVNGERVPGGPLTLQLTNVPEEQALETLLRPLSGYVAAPRTMQGVNLSRFDRILVMPTPAAPPAAAQATATTAPPMYPQPGASVQTVTQGAPAMQQPAAVPDDQEDDRPAPNTPRSPVFNTFPQPQVVNPPPPQTVPTATPGIVPPPPPVPAAAAPQPNAPITPPPTYPGAPTTPFGGVSVPGMVPTPPPGQTPNGAQPKRPGGSIR